MMEIELTRGQVALVDEVDADLAQWNWQALNRNGYWYVSTASKINGTHKGRSAMGRVIMERMIKRPLESHEIVRYQDGDQLNNTRANLTIAGRAWKYKKEAVS